MPEPRSYATAAAFRTALETRLRQRTAGSQASLGRLRRRVAFERLLARLFQEASSPWLLKGGYALELRLGDTARATRDLDLGVPYPASIAASGTDASTAIREVLADVAERDAGDWFAFAIGPATTDLDGPPGGGARYPVDCRLDGRIFAQFHLDVALGDGVAGEPEWLAGHDFLAFAGIPPARSVVLPAAQHFAEKVHAYSFPWRGRPNTRVRDLVDMVLLLDTGLLEPTTTAAGLRLTFARRATHPLPAVLLPPPEGWATPFAALAAEVALAERTADAAFARVARFFDALPLDR
jgi:hypothetical protein